MQSKSIKFECACGMKFDSYKEWKQHYMIGQPTVPRDPGYVMDRWNEYSEQHKLEKKGDKA